jgi:hypothetical protein
MQIGATASADRPIGAHHRARVSGISSFPVQPA